MPRHLILMILTLFVLAAAQTVSANDAIWIDVRTADEYNANHVSVAHNIPYTEITQRINEITRDKDALVYVYCRSGRRSGIAKSSLDEMGFTNVVNIGGFQQAQETAVNLDICPEAETADC